MKRLYYVGIITSILLISFFTSCLSTKYAVDRSYFDQSIPYLEHSRMIIGSAIKSIDGKPVAKDNSISSVWFLIPSGGHTFEIDFGLTYPRTESIQTMTLELLPGHYYEVFSADGDHYFQSNIPPGVWAGGIVDFTNPNNPLIVTTAGQEEFVQAALTAYSNVMPFTGAKDTFDALLRREEF